MWCCKLIFIFKSLSYGRGNLPEIQKTLAGHTAKHYSIKEFIKAKQRNYHRNCSLQLQSQHRIRCTERVKYVGTSSELPKSKVSGTNQSACTMQEMWDKAGGWWRAFRSLNDCLCLNSYHGKWPGKSYHRHLWSHPLVAWLSVAEWIKPDGEMFVLA